MGVVGVLALQGSFNEHIAALRRLGVKGVEIRKPKHLQSISSLIIPGGESTTMAKLAEFHNLIQSFEAELVVPELASKEGGPETFRGVFIRAPAILEVGPEVEVLADYHIPSNKVLYSSSAVEIHEESAVPEKKVIVAVKQGKLLGTAFHPELTADTRWHSYFLKMASDIEGATSNAIVAASSSDPQTKYDLPIFR